MSQQTIDIERVVREVLAQMGASSIPCAAAGSSNGTASGATAGLSSSAADNSRPKGQSVNPRNGSDKSQTPLTLALSRRERGPGADGAMVIESRVVTMDDVLGRLASVRRVVVSRKAIVTPAVQDELLRRNIELAYSDDASAKTAAPRLAIICSGIKFDPASLIAGLGREGVQAEWALCDCLISATDQLAAELGKSNTLCLLLTPHTAAGLCLANRLRGVRAVAGVDANTVAAATVAVGANLLVLNPATGTFFQLKQMVTEFCRGGVRPCPEVFRRQLG